MKDPFATGGEPTLTIPASDPDVLPILKLMIARAHSQREHAYAAVLIGWRGRFRKWIDDDRLRRASSAAVKAGVGPGEEKATSPPVLPDEDTAVARDDTLEDAAV